MGKFGWSMPAGCSETPYDKTIPKECDECEHEECPYEGHEEFCFKLSLIESCVICKKRIFKVKGSIKEENVATGMTEAIFCCSKECKEKVEEEVEKY